MESGTIKYKVNLACKNSDIEASNTLNSQNYKGGNALIGELSVRIRMVA